MRDRRVTVTRGLCVAAALVLALAGCGGDDGDEDAGDGTTTTEAAETTTTGSEDEGDDTTEPEEEPSTTEVPTTTAPEVDVQALVNGIDLTVEDLEALSPGWAVDDSEDEEDDELDIESCMGPAGELEPQAESEGRLFVNESGLPQAVATATAMFGSVEDATAFMDAAASDEFLPCADDVLLEGSDGGELEAFPSGTRYGDQWIVIGGLAEVEGTQAAVDFHLLRTGPFISMVFYIDTAGGGEAAAYVVDGMVDLLDERHEDAVEELG